MRSWKKVVPLLLAIGLLLVLFRVGIPGLLDPVPVFWKPQNLLDLAQQISVNAIIAFGMTLTILIGGIDLSVGAVLALVGTTTAYVLFRGQGSGGGTALLLLAVLAGMGVAAVFGACNGVLAATTRMPPFIITLATMLIARGCALRFNESKPIAIPDEQALFLQLGNGRLLGIPLPVVVLAAVFLAGTVLLHRTRFG
jgi:ribose transport system permease protein